MSRHIFVNLPVKDLNKAVEFFTQVGFSFDPRFTDENATCMIIAENIFVMLLVEDFFRTFIRKEIADSSKFTESIIAISAPSREEVDKMANRALAAGAHNYKAPMDQDFMYQRSFQDLDGHLWEIVWMDEKAVMQQVTKSH